AAAAEFALEFHGAAARLAALREEIAELDRRREAAEANAAELAEQTRALETEAREAAEELERQAAVTSDAVQAQSLRLSALKQELSIQEAGAPQIAEQRAQLAGLR
ncbi:unnamed protein product, partial [Phaeothamnion confervicola]